MNDESHISKSTFIQADRDTKLLLLFEMVHLLHHKADNSAGSCIARLDRCTKQFDRLNKTKWFYPVGSFFGGVIGGVIAVIIKGWDFFKQ